MNLEEQIQELYGLKSPVLRHLNAPTNEVIQVAGPDGQFAIKVYNVKSRAEAQVQWEVSLIRHLAENGVPVVKPIPGRNGYVEHLILEGEKRAAVLFEWARGNKPKPSRATFELVGAVAAQIHKASDKLTNFPVRDEYDADVLIDQQLERMKVNLTEARRWDQTVALGDRLKRVLANPNLDRGICHMDLTLDNVHEHEGELVVFDFDSAGTCWRALEPHGVLKALKDFFQAWLKGYRAVRSFSEDDERAVSAFVIVGAFRVVAWNLGVAKSSRGVPKLTAADMPKIVDEWLKWEESNTAGFRT
jgi:Ser/Thr protein kinase RdoA (MazF antagonist)